MKTTAVVVGAGVGGLMAAAELALAGVQVTVLEAAGVAGGKMRREQVGPYSMDVGPTVLTLRHVFDDVFERAGLRLDDFVVLRRQQRLARHIWPDGRTLDLYPDVEQSAHAIGELFGAAAARGYRAYAAYSEKLYHSAQEPFIYAERPTLLRAAWRFGRRAFTAACEMDAGRSMDAALLEHFPDTPELRQLFGRYATYQGGSPYEAPATLHLISHVERLGVWSVAGGLSQLAAALARLVEHLGGEVRVGAPVARVLTQRRRATGVVLASGEHVAADAVVLGTDVALAEAGALWPEGAGEPRVGDPTDGPHRQPELPAQATGGEHGLSALVFALVGTTSGRPLLGHNVLFRGGGSQSEYEALFSRRQMVADPSVYLYAPDRAEQDGDGELSGEERLFALINAPAGMPALTDAQVSRWQNTLMQRLQQAGVQLSLTHEPLIRQPAHFAQRFPGSLGALYGRPPHGWRTFFARGGSRTRIGNLMRAGGGVHPGAGVPMAALSGRLAAEALLRDVRSMRPSPRAATPGGTWTPPPTTADMR